MEFPHSLTIRLGFSYSLTTRNRGFFATVTALSKNRWFAAGVEMVANPPDLPLRVVLLIPMGHLPRRFFPQ